MNSKIPEHYPTQQHSASPSPPKLRHVINITKLQPVEITYEWLKQGCKFCFHNVYHGIWNIQSATIYMKSLGIKPEFARTNVIDVAKDLRNNKIQHESDQIFSYLNYPPFWTGPYSLIQNIDTPMHLLFQGIIKSIIEMTFEWLKLHSKQASYCAYINSSLNDIKNLQCRFCRTETLKTGNEYTIGGWIAENYLGFTRVISNIFGYTRKFISFDYTQEIDAYEFMIQTCLAFIYRLMTNAYVSMDELDDYIKIFLSAVHNFECLTYVEQSNRSYVWYSKGNFLSLLNLPDQIRDFESVRNYWEGSRERYIQLVKPYMKNNRDTDSFLHLQMKHVLSSTILKNIMSETSKSSNNKYERYNHIRRYRNTQEVTDCIEKGKPISLIITECKEKLCICCVIGKSSSFSLHIIICNDNDGFLHCGLWYCSISISSEPYTIFETYNDVLDNCKNCIIAMSHSFLESSMYMMFTEDWYYRYNNGDFALPSFTLELQSQFKI